MRRREFITLLGGVVAASPLAVRAQQPAVPVVGFVHLFSPDKVPRSWVAAFPQGLKEAGFTEGQNVAVEYHWAQGEADRYSALVADLARRQVAVIAATGGEPCPQLAEAITQTIPIVFTANGDPVQEGLVASLHHPGGNATGVTIFGAPAAAKRMQLLQDCCVEPCDHRLSNESKQSKQQNRTNSCRGGCSFSRKRNTDPPGQQRERNRGCICKNGPAAWRRASQRI